MCEIYIIIFNIISILLTYKNKIFLPGPLLNVNTTPQMEVLVIVPTLMWFLNGKKLSILAQTCFLKRWYRRR